MTTTTTTFNPSSQGHYLWSIYRWWIFLEGLSFVWSIVDILTVSDYSKYSGVFLAFLWGLGLQSVERGGVGCLSISGKKKHETWKVRRLIAFYGVFIAWIRLTASWVASLIYGEIISTFNLLICGPLQTLSMQTTLWANTDLYTQF